MTMPNEGMERAVGGDPRITPQQLAAARQRVRWGSGLSRTELARTICEPWGWVTASGSYKVTAGWKVLAEWAARGLRRLPGKRRITRGHTDRAWGAVRPQRTESGAPLVGARSVAGPVELEVIQSRGHGQRWNEYEDRYHYLGYRQPFGCQLRYFMASSAGVLGWVQVRHRASQVLGPLARRGRRDWPARWGYAPLGLETCVAPDRFAGTCYRAAGGPALARTTGRGLARAGQSYPSTPKLIYVPGLAADFRPQLCGGPLARRVEL